MEVKCTQCGGSVPVKTDQGAARCDFCGSSLYISLRDGFLHYLISPMVPEKDVPKVLQTYLEKKERRSSFKVKRTSRVYWPFWEVQEGDNVKTYIAATNPITALEDAEIPPGNARPFLAEEIGSDWVEPPSERVEDIIAREGISPGKIRLIHLPFWIVNYEYDGVSYEAWMDAVRGHVYADELPPTFEKLKDRLYAYTAFAIFAIFFIIGISVPKPNIAFLAYIAASLPLFFGAKYMLRDIMS